MNEFGWDIISYFFMCALSIAASPQNSDTIRINIAEGQHHASTTLIKREDGIYKLKKWSKAGGASWAVIRSEVIADRTGQKQTLYMCRDSSSKETVGLSYAIPNLHSLNIKTASNALLQSRDGHTTIKMKRSGGVLYFSPSPFLPSDLHLRSKQTLPRSSWIVTF